VNVLLLHAGIADRRMWAPQVEALAAAGHDVTAPDLPGYGETPLEPGTIAYVDHAAALLDGPAAVVGASFGGSVALELALARPELVARLALVGSSIRGWTWSEAAESGFAEEEALLEAGDLAGAARQQADMWLGPDASPPVRELTEAMTLRTYELQLPLDGQVSGSWPEPRALERLGEIAAPTLVVVGAEDAADIREAAARLAAEIPQARLETVAGAGHLPSLERPDEVNRLLVDFLR
jgi:pimeloyl-ACP methyl ester carboxylesterase